MSPKKYPSILPTPQRWLGLRCLMSHCLMPRCLMVLAMMFVLTLWGSDALRVIAEKKPPTAEEIVERVILVYGTRGGIYGIQRNGIIKANIKLTSGDTIREGRTVTKFIRRKKIAEDLVLLDLELAEMKYLMGFDGEKVWANYNGEAVEADAKSSRAFRASHLHSYESLLRYKENEAKLEYVSTEKIGTLEIDTVDLVLPDGDRTRFHISRRSSHILFLEYETRNEPDAAPVKYRLAFSDFRAIQNTLIPYRTQILENGKQIEERKLIEVAYNVQLEESAFKQGGGDNKAAQNIPGP
jgi:hypothetical protein